MYEIDEADRVIELDDLPASSGGAPSPTVVARDDRLFLFYFQDSDESNENEWPFAVVKFEQPKAHFFGPPNDEAFSGHPLAARGLKAYGAYEVIESSWIRLLERRNRVHPNHRAALFDGFRHFIIPLKDSTFECIAKGYESAVRQGSVSTAITAALQAVR